MERKYRVYYDEQYDRLMIAGKTEEDVIMGSVRLLNIILDFNSQNKVVNAELLRASEYLQSLGLDDNLLKQITGGSLSAKQLRNGYEIEINLKTKRKALSVPYNVHLPNQK